MNGFVTFYRSCRAFPTHGKLYLRGLAAANFSPEEASAVRILYGGSVKPDNISGLMAHDQIDGALVGGASLDPESFAAIVNF